MKIKLTFAVSTGMLLLAMIPVYAQSKQPQNAIPSNQINEAVSKKYRGKKILFIDSYHEGYEWSDGITRGVVGVLKDTGAELKIHRMDTKRNDNEDFQKQAGLKAKSIIEEFKPDVVIASDDSAFKYLIMPYFKDADLPIAFCGINWDVSIYGAPYKNTTGMIEVGLIDRLIKFLREYSKGDRVAVISSDNLTSRKNADAFEQYLNVVFTGKVFVKDFAEWKEKLIGLQDKADILILDNNAGIEGWDKEEARLFAEKSIKIPTGTFNEWMMPYSLIGLIKIPEEQGEWAAQAALRILDGVRPSDIPLAKNKKGKIILNFKIAERLGVAFKPILLKGAEIIR